jgi:predicted HTH transcriptional regulator
MEVKAIDDKIANFTITSLEMTTVELETTTETQKEAIIEDLSNITASNIHNLKGSDKGMSKI